MTEDKGAQIRKDAAELNRQAGRRTMEESAPWMQARAEGFGRLVYDFKTKTYRVASPKAPSASTVKPASEDAGGAS